jgi:hypothetical protein
VRKNGDPVNLFFSVFSGAAPIQRTVFVLLICAIVAGLAGVAASLTRRALPMAWRRGLNQLRTAGPSIGLLVASLDGLHIASTILRLPSDPTLKDLAPGIQEVTALLALGALAGLVATVALAAERGGYTQ